MNAHNQLKSALTAIEGGVTADASKVSPREFFDAVFGSKRDEYLEQLREQCIRGIKRGDVYGLPAALVAECREAMKPVCDVCGETLPDHAECNNCSAQLIFVERISPTAVML